MCFYDFLKNCEFWSKFDFTNVFLVKFSIRFMYLYELYIQYIRS